MTFDVLSRPLDACAWAEPAAESGFAAFWDRELFGVEIPSWRHNVVGWIEQAYHARDGQPVVVGDIGCGAALYARHLLAAGVPCEYHGYDHNAGVLAAACRRWEFLPHANVNLHQMDARAERWPVADESFDIIIWDTTLRFCENAEAALSESLRVCRGWVLIARTPLEQRTWRESVQYYGMETPSPNWHFEDAYFRDLTQRHEWYFTPRAGDDELHILSRQPLPRSAAIRPVANHARAFHAAYVRERVGRLFEQIPGDWALYGAGRHTRWLLSVLPETCTRRIRLVLDDAARPGQTLAGIRTVTASTMRGDAEHPLRGIAAVLLSSDTIEPALFTAARQSLPQTVPLFRLYEGFAAGPYDKSLPPIDVAGGDGIVPHAGRASSSGRLCRA